MYIARFSYHVLPADRGRAIEYIHREVDAARKKKLGARLLVPLTRGEGGRRYSSKWKSRTWSSSISSASAASAPAKSKPAPGCMPSARSSPPRPTLSYCAWSGTSPCSSGELLAAMTGTVCPGSGDRRRPLSSAAAAVILSAE